MVQTPIWGYESLTDEEIKSWWSTLTLEQRIDEIRKLDIIEHSEPDVIFPTRIVILEGRNLHIFYPNERYIDVKIDEFLHYRIYLEDEEIKDFIPPDDEVGIIIISGLIGSAIGLLGGIVLGRSLP
jgi:hypothetical protein